jgi:hypothetical protein
LDLSQLPPPNDDLDDDDDAAAFASSAAGGGGRGVGGAGSGGETSAHDGFKLLPDEFVSFEKYTRAVFKEHHSRAGTVGELVSTNKEWFEIACPDARDPNDEIINVRRRGPLVLQSPCCNIQC